MLWWGQEYDGVRTGVAKQFSDENPVQFSPTAMVML